MRGFRLTCKNDIHSEFILRIAGRLDHDISPEWFFIDFNGLHIDDSIP